MRRGNCIVFGNEQNMRFIETGWLLKQRHLYVRTHWFRSGEKTPRRHTSTGLRSQYKEEQERRHRVHLPEGMTKI